MIIHYTAFLIVHFCDLKMADSGRNMSSSALYVGYKDSCILTYLPLPKQINLLMKKLFVHLTRIIAPKIMQALKTTVFWKVTSHTDVSEVPAGSRCSLEEDIFTVRGIIPLS